MDPFGAFFATINALFTAADFAVRVGEVGSENEVFVRTIQIVRNDLNETERILGLKSIQQKLISNPSKLEWIKGAIYSTKSALNDIGKWVERARVDQQSLGKVKFENKVRWVFNDHEKLLNRKTELSACHQQLSNVLAFLVPLEETSVGASAKPPTYYATTFFDDIVSPRQHSRSISSDTRPGSHPVEANRDYFPSAAASTAQSSASSVSPAVHAYSNPEPQRRPKSFSSASVTLAPGPNAPPPEYTAYDERVSDGMRYPGSEAADMRTSPEQHTSVDFGMDPLHTALGLEINVIDHKQHKPLVMLSHTKSLALRGTNNYGPVNPLELFLNPITENTQFPQLDAGTLNSDCPPQPKPNTDDKSFPVKLPTNDAGPPPGYPRTITGKPVLELPASVPQLTFEGPNSQYQAQAQATSRPTSRVLSPKQAPQELPASSPPRSPAFRSGTHDSFSSVSLLSDPSSVTTTTSPWSTSVTSLSTGVSPLSSPNLSSSTLYSSSWQTSRVRPASKPQPISSTRMRNQKSYLDLLESMERGR